MGPSAAWAGRRLATIGLLTTLALPLGACRDDGDDGAPMPADSAEAIAALDEARIAAADPADWPSHGRSYDEQRFSPLDGLDAGNVRRLGLVWHHDFAVHGTYEATPVVVDRVLYVTTPWSLVFAIDARTGREIWRYDPGLRGPDGGPAEGVPPMCCGAVNRGVAAWKGRIYVGTFDGRLVALDARTGEVLWERRTSEAGSKYSITGAPRVVDGKVLIGNGGADYGVRGYVSAYDAGSGDLVWRFFTVPEAADRDAPSSPAMARAAETWPLGDLVSGGGGTVWDALSYDPDSNLVYVGVGNGSPLNRYRRDPSGGDNLYLASIVALDADTGEYSWHFQTTPYEGWDYTATQQMILADLEIGGRSRAVLMQAPKNGFFYVLDRLTGEFLSGDPFAKVTWATGLDAATGRPIESEHADYEHRARIVFPSSWGAHNWHSMAFHPGTGLVYLPVREDYDVFANSPQRFVYRRFERDRVAAGLGLPKDVPPHRLSAWDPVAREERWRVEHPWPINGGVLATAGDLVFQGTAHGEFAAYHARDGKRLWRTFVQTGVVAAPVAFAVDGAPYVAVLAGNGSGLVPADGEPQRVRSDTPGRLLVFGLDGQAALPELPPPAPPPEPPPSDASTGTIRLGEQIYWGLCERCHGIDVVSFGPQPDLRYMSDETWDELDEILLEGSRADRGMPGFGEIMKPPHVEAVRAYLIHRIRESRP